MHTLKIAISIDEGLVKKIDSFVKKHIFPNRSKAIQQAVTEKMDRIEHLSLSRECAKLDSKYEQSLAEEGFPGEWSEWPKY